MKVVRLMLTKDKIVDIRENSIDAEVLAILLSDRSTGSNILWCTDDYSSLGEGYEFYDPIEVSRISGKNDGVIKPRIEKDKAAQELRSREKAEVFTPSWVCNVQNNLVDDAWFGISRRRFNTEKQEGWKTNYYPISFAETKGKTWNDYVRATRMEVSCGEAPYLTTRYDAVTGKYIPVRCRVGLLDRKLRVILENVSNGEEWIEWALIAVQNIYGYDWQGDNVLLARENILYSVIESFHDAFDMMLDKETIKQFAEIISWNIWQMDGIKFVVPGSCRPIPEEQMTLFDLTPRMRDCPGCKTGKPLTHTGEYCKIMDWDIKQPVRFIDIMKGADA